MEKLLTAQEMLVALYGLGMTDEEMAKATEVSQPTITRIRNGVHEEPRHKTWAAIQALYVEKTAGLDAAGGDEARAA